MQLPSPYILRTRNVPSLHLNKAVSAGSPVYVRVIPIALILCQKLSITFMEIWDRLLLRCLRMHHVRPLAVEICLPEIQQTWHAELLLCVRIFGWLSSITSRNLFAGSKRRSLSLSLFFFSFSDNVQRWSQSLEYHAPRDNLSFLFGHDHLLSDRYNSTYYSEIRDTHVRIRKSKRDTRRF